MRADELRGEDRGKTIVVDGETLTYVASTRNSHTVLAVVADTDGHHRSLRMTPDQEIEIAA